MLKGKLTEAPLLLLLDKERPFIIMTDASDDAARAVLMQNAAGGLQPVEYILRRFNEIEMRYCNYNKEMLGVIYALRSWRHFLEGRPFQLHTDHQTIRHLLTQRTLTRRQARWSEFLQDLVRQMTVNKGALGQRPPSGKNRAMEASMARF